MQSLKNKTRILFRADGNSQIGLGHVVRSLALAELLREKFSCEFAIQNPSEALLVQLKTVCDTIIFLPETKNESRLLKEAENLATTFTGQEIIVLDGYQFTTLYQEKLKQKGSILVCLDDLHNRTFIADAIINISGGVKPERYATAPYTKLCLGPEYALLRKPFREAQKMIGKRDEKVAKILICFGGADPDNFTLRYAQKLHSINPDYRLEIVIGSAYLHSKNLQNFLSEKRNVNLHQNLSAAEMAALMQQCSVAVCSASSVAYEYCAVNGMLFVEKTADNQADLYQFLISEKLALSAEKMEEFLTSADLETITKKLSQKQREIFNGRAEENLQNLFAQLELQAQLTFRKVTENDAQLLFEWANDPVVRQFSFNPEPIPFETHVNWLNGKLNNPNALLLLAEIKNQPVALLRFDINVKIALISYQIGAAFRGKGLGHRVLQVGLIELQKYIPEVTEAIGFVQEVNVASVRAFEKAAFENLGIDEEQQAFKFSKILF